MSDFPEVTRSFHPAVALLNKEWPAIPVGDHRDIEMFQQSSAAELVVHRRSRMIVVSYNFDPAAGLLVPEQKISEKIENATIQELIELRWLLRDLGTHDHGTRTRTITKPLEIFILPEHVISSVRSSMISAVRAKGALREPDLAVSKIVDDDIKEFIFYKIDNMFFVLADLYLTSGRTTPLIATEGGFDTAVVTALLERFDINYIESMSFANGIYSAVWNYIKLGGEFSGDWGRVARIGQNLYMSLSPASGTAYSDDQTVDLTFD